jgi:PAS domain S-box-containing protein
MHSTELNPDRDRTDRLERLQEATARLAGALTEADVGLILLSVAEGLLRAAAGVVYLEDPDGSFRLVASRGVAASVDSRLRTLPLDGRAPLSTALAQRSPIFIPSYQALLAQYPHLATADTPAPRLRSVAALPLIHGERLLGGLALSFDTEQHFDDDARRWLGGIAAQAALAVDRARLYESEKRARREAEAARLEAECARDEAETLFRIAESITATQLDLEAVVQRVTDEATRLTGAGFGAFFYNVVDAAGESYMLYTLSGAPKESFAKFGLPRNTPIFAPTFAGEAIVRLDDVKKDPRYGTMSPHHGMPKGHLPVTSYLAVPVISRSGQVLGGLFFGHSEPARFQEKHERLVQSLAATAALAIDNAKMYRAARAAAESHQRLAENLAETVRLNELFMGVLAHDLRAPLSAVMTAAQVIRMRPETASDPRNVRALDRIVASGERMSRMIEQLLDFTRLRIGNGLALQIRDGDLQAVVRLVVDELQQASAQSSIAVQRTGDLIGSWDPDRLGQVFSNLIGNALQHGADQHVRVTLDGSSEDRVQVQIQNAGAIPADLLPRVFEPMTGSKRRPEKARGLGLGLFITKEIVTAHGGQVAVSSAEAEGTTFTVTLPRHSERTPQAAVSAGDARPQATVQGDTARLAGEDVPAGEARFRLLVESVKDYAIFMLDPTGRVVTWNNGARRIKGYDAGEIIGQHFSRFYEEAEIRAGKCEMELVCAARDGRFEDEGWRLRKDGSRFWANVVITALRNKNGDLIGFAKVTRDLTERRVLEQERLRRAHAEEAIRLRDNFLSLASHELKTPLAILQMQLDMLDQRIDASDQRATTLLQRAARSSERLTALVESLLDVSRFGTRDLALEVADLDLGELVDRIVEGLAPIAARSGSDLRLRTGGPIVGRWDGLRLEQVLNNLLSNAIKHGAGKPIDVWARQEDGEVVVDVRDRGPGVVGAGSGGGLGQFERAASGRHHGGLGLGLSLIQEIVAAHGGTVTAENAEGGGALFRVRLPVRAPALGGEPDGQEGLRH